MLYGMMEYCAFTIDHYNKPAQSFTYNFANEADQNEEINKIGFLAKCDA